MAISKEEYSKEQLKESLMRLLKNTGDVDGLIEYLDDEESDDEELIEKGAEQLADEAYEKVLENMYCPPFMFGHYPDGSGMFEHEFLYYPACQIYSEVGESVLEGFDLYFMDEIWLLANGDCAHVEHIWFKIGDFSLHYRRLMGMIGDDYQSPACSEDVVWGISKLVTGYFDEEDTE